jgi:hypothetical protein
MGMWRGLTIAGQTDEWWIQTNGLGDDYRPLIQVMGASWEDRAGPKIKTANIKLWAQQATQRLQMWFDEHPDRADAIYNRPRGFR